MDSGIDFAKLLPESESGSDSDSENKEQQRLVSETMSMDEELVKLKKQVRLADILGIVWTLHIWPSTVYASEILLHVA